MTSRAPVRSPGRRHGGVGRLIAPAAAVIAAALLTVWLAGSAMIRGGGTPVPAARVPSRDIRLTSGDAGMLAAAFRPGLSDRSPGVLLLHGVGASRAATAANAAWLARLGHATLTLNFQGHGQSTTTPRGFRLPHEAGDAGAGLAWLKRR